MTDWASISSLATAGGTFVLALATFASVRSAHRAARTAERALLAGIRPVLTPSNLEDSPLKVGFADGHWVRPPGGGAVAEVTDQAIYMAISLRNVGSGMAVLHGWMLYPERRLDASHADPGEFRRLTRDIYISPSSVGFWQGAFREPGAPEFAASRDAIQAREALTVDILYGDQEGGQRMISRFGLMPRDDGTWLASVGRHWNVDRADPR